MRNCYKKSVSLKYTYFKGPCKHLLRFRVVVVCDFIVKHLRNLETIKLIYLRYHTSLNSNIIFKCHIIR